MRQAWFLAGRIVRAKRLSSPSSDCWNSHDVEEWRARDPSDVVALSCRTTAAAAATVASLASRDHESARILSKSGVVPLLSRLIAVPPPVQWRREENAAETNVQSGTNDAAAAAARALAALCSNDPEASYQALLEPATLSLNEPSSELQLEVLRPLLVMVRGDRCSGGYGLIRRRPWGTRRELYDLR